MDLSDWQLAFGKDRLTYLRGIDDQLPSDARNFLTEYGFPTVVAFEALQAFEILFSPFTKPLVAYNTLIRWGDFPNPELDAAWADQRVIGEEEFWDVSCDPQYVWSLP